MTSDFRHKVEIRPFRACAMHPAIIIGTVRSLWTWLWGRYHVPQNAFLVVNATVTLTVHWYLSKCRSLSLHSTANNDGPVGRLAVLNHLINVKLYGTVLSTRARLQKTST